MYIYSYISVKRYQTHFSCQDRFYLPGLKFLIYKVGVMVYFPPFVPKNIAAMKVHLKSVNFLWFSLAKDMTTHSSNLA